MTYEYLCTACGHEWEAEQRISEDALKDCPTCGEAAAKRQVSGGMGFVLKGAGWYSDLYGLKQKPSAETGGGAAAGSSATKGEGSKESTKPAKESAAVGDGGKTEKPAVSSSAASSSSSSASAA